MKLSEPLQLVLARALALSWQYWQALRRVEEGLSNSVGHTLDLLDTCTYVCQFRYQQSAALRKCQYGYVTLRACWME